MFEGPWTHLNRANCMIQCVFLLDEIVFAYVLHGVCIILTKDDLRACAFSCLTWPSGTCYL